MPNLLSKNDDRDSEKHNQDIDASLRAKGIYIPIFGNPRNNAV